MGVSVSGAALRIHPICGNRPYEHDRQPPLGYFYGGVTATGDASGGAVSLQWLPEGQTSSPIGRSAAKYIWLFEKITLLIAPAPAASQDVWTQITGGNDPPIPGAGLPVYGIATSVAAIAQTNQPFSQSNLSLAPSLLVIPNTVWPIHSLTWWENNIDASVYSVHFFGWVWDKKLVEELGLGIEWPLALRRGNGV